MIRITTALAIFLLIATNVSGNTKKQVFSLVMENF